MLVLSRHCNERIALPTSGATIDVLAIGPDTVALGIEAPFDMAILQDQVEEQARSGAAASRLAASSSTPVQDGTVRHLKAASNGLGLARLQLRAGRVEDAEAILAKLHNGFQRWRKRAEGVSDRNRPKAPDRPRKAHRVLLVEDNANERELLALLLRRSGLEVDTACDGLEALNRLQAPTRPDMLLLDMGLPRCDGPTTVREIRRNPDYLGLKIFAVSGHTPDEYGLATNSSGIDRWFCKPIDPDRLIHDVSRELALSIA